MRVDAPAGQLREHRVVREPEDVEDLAGRRIDGDRVLLGGPAALDLLHDVRGGLVRRRDDLHRVAQPLGSGRGQHLVEADAVLAGAPGTGRRAMARVLAARGGRDGRGGLAEGGAQDVDVGARVRRPGQAGGGEEDEAGRGPDTDGAVQTEGAAPSAGAAHLALGTAAGEPQHQTAARYHPQPARGEFAVEAAVLTEVQIAVELAEPGTQGQRARRSVLFERALDLRGVRVDEHGERVVRADTGHAGQHDPRRGVVLGRGAHGRDAALGMGLAGGGHLLGDRQLGVPRGDGELVGVDDLLGLEGGRVQSTAQGGDQQERGDEQTRVEVQPQDERAEGGGWRTASPGRRVSTSPVRPGISSVVVVGAMDIGGLLRWAGDGERGRRLWGWRSGG